MASRAVEADDGLRTQSQSVNSNRAECALPGWVRGSETRGNQGLQAERYCRRCGHVNEMTKPWASSIQHQSVLTFSTSCIPQRYRSLLATVGPQFSVLHYTSDVDPLDLKMNSETQIRIHVIRATPMPQLRRQLCITLMIGLHKSLGW